MEECVKKSLEQQLFDMKGMLADAKLVQKRLREHNNEMLTEVNRLAGAKQALHQQINELKAQIDILVTQVSYFRSDLRDIVQMFCLAELDIEMGAGPLDKISDDRLMSYVSRALVSAGKMASRAQETLVEHMARNGPNPHLNEHVYKRIKYVLYGRWA